MNRKWLGAGVAVLVSGCASVEMAQYSVTSFAEVPLKEKAKVKIVANNDFAKPLAKALEGELKNKAKALSVVEEGADYYFCIGGAYASAKTTSQKVYSTAEVESGNGGKEEISGSSVNLSSAAQGVGVSVYETESLAPVYYMEIPLYDGDNGAKAARESDAYAKVFAQDTVERIMDVFVTQKKDVETKIPLEADSNLRESFKKRDYSVFKDNLKVDIDKVVKQIAEGTYQGEKLEKILANYTLYLLAKEAQTDDQDQLSKIKDEQLKIIENCDAAGLVESVPVALARLEYKLSNLVE